jgi:hypothetical protein
LRIARFRRREHCGGLTCASDTSASFNGCSQQSSPVPIPYQRRSHKEQSNQPRPPQNKAASPPITGGPVTSVCQTAQKKHHDSAALPSRPCARHDVVHVRSGDAANRAAGCSCLPAVVARGCRRHAERADQA